jgi:hypothetical protein
MNLWKEETFSANFEVLQHRLPQAERPWVLQDVNSMTLVSRNLNEFKPERVQGFAADTAHVQINLSHEARNSGGSTSD